MFGSESGWEDFVVMRHAGMATQKKVPSPITQIVAMSEDHEMGGD